MRWLAAACLVPVAALALVPPPAAAGGEATARLTLVARSLAADYGVKRPDAPRLPLAVFDFACPPDLAAERVGYAVAELLMARLASATQFQLVERSDLNRLLGEQALQQTGATDTNTAVQMGKVVGARLAISGGVARLGGAYDVTARLADVETGEVLAVAVQELPAKAFEAEAQPYLNLVPEEEAIGVYVGGGVGLFPWFSNRGPVTVGSPALGTESTATSGRLPRVSGWIGVRYFVAPTFELQASFLPLAFQAIVDTNLSAGQPSSAGNGTDGRECDFSATGGDLSGFWVHPLGSSLRLVAGVGAGLVSFGQSVNSTEVMTTSGPLSTALQLEGNQGVFRPHADVAVEWKLQSRLGWTLGLTVYPLPGTVKLDVIETETGTDAGTLVVLTLPPVALNTSFALYF